MTAGNEALALGHGDFGREAIPNILCLYAIVNVWGLFLNSSNSVAGKRLTIKIWAIELMISPKSVNLMFYKLNNILNSICFSLISAHSSNAQKHKTYQHQRGKSRVHLPRFCGLLG